MDETLITETTTQAGQKKKKATKYINPSATNEQVKGFAQLATALTTDNYDGAYVTSYRTKGEVVFQTKPTPNLSLGGWSAVDTVYAAPITYDGDGELSVNVGSISNGSLIVNDADGIFNGVLTASAGESYASTSFGFSYDTDYVTIQGGGGDIPDSIISSLGKKFVPTVSTSADFIDNADNNIKFFNNKLKQFFAVRNDYLLFSDDNTNLAYDAGLDILIGEQIGFSGGEEFLWGQTRVNMEFDDSTNKLYLTSTATDDTILIATDTATRWNYGTVVKLSETTGWAYSSVYLRNGTYQYQGGCYVKPFSLTSDGSIVSAAVTTVTSSNTSSVAAHNHQRRVTFARSCINPKSTTCVFYQKGNNNPVSYTNMFNANNRTGAAVALSGLAIGTVQASPNGKTNLEFLDFAEQYPAVIQFNGEDVTLSKSSTPTHSPFIYYQHRTRNSSGSITSGQDVVRINAGGYPAPDSYVILSTITGGVQSKLNDWVEDNGYFIHGTYPNKARTDCYVVTYKPGTYSKDTYLQNAFKVWNVDFTTPRFVQSSKTLPQVLNDLVI